MKLPCVPFLLSCPSCQLEQNLGYLDGANAKISPSSIDQRKPHRMRDLEPQLKRPSYPSFRMVTTTS